VFFGRTEAVRTPLLRDEYLVLAVAIVTALMACYLLIWTLVDPIQLRSQVELTKTYVSHHTCSSIGEWAPRRGLLNHDCAREVAAGCQESNNKTCVSHYPITQPAREGWGGMRWRGGSRMPRVASGFSLRLFRKGA
jgi:hypothetical protein